MPSKRDIVIPVKDFVKEHKHLISLLNKYDAPALRKEAADQSKELREMTGGTRREDVLRKYGLEDKSYSLKELSDTTKVPMKILREVYNRGVGAYKTQPKSVRLKGSFVKNVDAPMSAKLSKEQWGMARVYSFLDGNEKHDNDLRQNTGGMGQASGFIRRLMAENYLKHKGQYKNPTYPLAEDSTMNKPAKFDYQRIANAEQNGTNQSNYGASPFIQKHFGHARAVPFVRKRAVATAAAEETPQQKEARAEFDQLQSYKDEAKHYRENKIEFFASDNKKGAAARWFGVLKDGNVAAKANGTEVAFRTGFDAKSINTDNGEISTDYCELYVKDVNQRIRSIKVLNIGKDGAQTIIKQTGDLPTIAVEVEYNNASGQTLSRQMHLEKLYEYANDIFIGELAQGDEEDKKHIDDALKGADIHKDYKLTIHGEAYVLPK